MDREKKSHRQEARRHNRKMLSHKRLVLLKRCPTAQLRSIFSFFFLFLLFTIFSTTMTRGISVERHTCGDESTQLAWSVAIAWFCIERKHEMSEICQAADGARWVCQVTVRPIKPGWHVACRNSCTAEVPCQMWNWSICGKAVLQRRKAAVAASPFFGAIARRTAATLIDSLTLAQIDMTMIIIIIIMILFNVCLCAIALVRRKMLNKLIIYRNQLSINLAIAYPALDHACYFMETTLFSPSLRSIKWRTEDTHAPHECRRRLSASSGRSNRKDFLPL